MATEIKGLKISQIPEITKLTGTEMIPCEYGGTNGKFNASKLANYITENLDPYDPDGKLAQLENKVNNISGDVNNLETNITNLGSDIDGLESKVTQNTKDISSNTTKITNNTNNISDLNDSIGNLDQRVTKNTNDIANIKIATGDVSDITDELNKLKTRVSTNETNIGTNTSNISKNTNSINQANTKIEQLGDTCDDLNTAITAINNSKGAAGGLASLGSDGKVPSSQLPTLGGDSKQEVFMYASKSSFPTSGIDQTALYIAKDDNKVYRYSGSAWIEVSPTTESDPDVKFYNSKGAFPSTGTQNIIYVDKTTNKIYMWDGSAYTELAGSTATDEIKFYDAKSGFPTTGDTEVLYVDKATNKIYRWNGSAYTEIAASSGSSSGGSDDVYKLDITDFLTTIQGSITSSAVTELIQAIKAGKSIRGVSEYGVFKTDCCVTAILDDTTALDGVKCNYIYLSIYLQSDSGFNDGSTEIYNVNIVGYKNTWSRDKNIPWELITYRDLVNKIELTNLVPGKKYAITDYACTYWRPINLNTMLVTEDVSDDFTMIICTATTISRISPDVQIIRESSRVPIIEAKYSLDADFCGWTKGITQAQGFRGVIYHLKDANNNEAYYDFKHVKFRRWGISDITANITADTGSNINVTPYRCFLNSNSRALSDNRQFCGCGDPIENTLIPAIFNGKWRCGGETTPRFPTLKTNSGIAQPLTPYHDDYITSSIKPYQDTNYISDRYLSWQTDMFAENGLSNGYVSSATWMGGLSNVTVLTERYVDSYTFGVSIGSSDPEEADASELSSSGYYYVKGNVFKTPAMEYSEMQLPNTVIRFSRTAIDRVTGTNKSRIQDNIFWGGVKNNTFLLVKPNSSTGRANIERNEFGIGGDTFESNLIIAIGGIVASRIQLFRHNYVCGRLSDFQVSNALYNVLFGYYSYTRGTSMNRNLLFGNDYYVKTTSDTSYKNSYDGEYWYSNTIKDNFYANIMGPFQYGDFKPHVNSNLVKAVYNKGARFDSSNQLCSYDAIQWGTTIGYGVGQGIYFGKMIHSTIPSAAFIGVSGENTTSVNGVEMMDPNKASKALPMLTEVDLVSSYPANPHTMIDTITSMTHYPTTKSRHVIYCDSSNVWHLTNWYNVLSGTSTQALAVDEVEEQGMSVEDFAKQQPLYPDVEMYDWEAE